MHSVAVSILLVIVAQVNAKELVANHFDDSQDSLNNVVEALVSKLFDRVLTEPLSHRADLDTTALEKPSQLALSTARLSTSKLGTPISHLPGASPSAPPRLGHCLRLPAQCAMKYNQLGNSDLMVSEVCLGTMTWGEQNTEEEGIEQLRMAFDEMGVNFLDTAEAYPIPLKAETQGRTDQAIARWLKESKIPRDKVILATKVCGNSEGLTWFRKDGKGTQVSHDQIMESVDASLKRLGVDYIDLLQIHWPDRYVPLFGPARYNTTQERDSVPISEQVRAMGELVKQGKIRYYGLSNETPYGTMSFVQAAKEQGVPPPISIQNSYSLLVREFEAGLTEVCSKRHENIGLLAYSPLAGGVLTGKYAKPGVAAPNSRLMLLPGYKDRYEGSSAPQAVAKYAEVAAKYGMTPTEFAQVFCKSRAFIPSTIIGATTIEQLKENVNAFNKEWTAEMETDVEKIAKAYPEPWRTPQKGGG